MFTCPAVQVAYVYMQLSLPLPPFLHLSPPPSLPLFLPLSFPLSLPSSSPSPSPSPSPLPPSQSRVQILKANLRKSPIAKVPSHQWEGLIHL